MPDSADTPQRRSEKRIAARLVVNLRLPGARAFIERYSENVSPKGIFIVTREVHPPGTVLSFEIRGSEGTVLFAGTGKVHWVREHDPATRQAAGLGIQFLDLDAPNREFLSELLAAKVQGTSGAHGPAQLKPVSAGQPRPSAVSNPFLRPVSVAPALQQRAWPASVPPIDQAFDILAGGVAISEDLQVWTSSFLGGLSVGGRNALTGADTSPDAAPLRWVIAVAWRLTIASQTRPADKKALIIASVLDQLFADADEALAILDRLGASKAPEVAAARKQAREVIAKNVQLLLPMSDAAAIRGDVALAIEHKRAREAQAIAAASRPAAPVVKPIKETGPMSRRAKTAAAVLLGALSLVGVGYNVVYLIPTAPLALPELPRLPPNTVVLGNPKSGSVIIQSVNKQLPPSDAVETFTAEAKAKGITVLKLNPKQLLLTVQHP